MKMRVLLLASVSAIGLAGSAHAQVGLCNTVDGPCASQPNQLLELAKQAQQVIQETQTAIQEVQNTIAIPLSLFNDLTCEINALQSLVSQANMLVGNTGAMISSLGQPGGYPIGTIADLGQEMTNEMNAVAGGVTALSNVIGSQNPGGDASNMAQLEGNVLSTGGRLAAIMGHSDISSATGQQTIQHEVGDQAYQQALVTIQVAAFDRDAAQTQLRYNMEYSGIQAACAAGAATGSAIAQPGYCSPTAFPVAVTTGPAGGIQNMGTGPIAGAVNAAATCANNAINTLAGGAQNQDFSGGDTGGTAGQDFSGGTTGADAGTGNQDFSGGSSNTTSGTSNQDFSGGTVAPAGTASTSASTVVDDSQNTDVTDTSIGTTTTVGVDEPGSATPSTTTNAITVDPTAGGNN